MVGSEIRRLSLSALSIKNPIKKWRSSPVNEDRVELLGAVPHEDVRKAGPVKLRSENLPWSIPTCLRLEKRTHFFFWKDPVFEVSQNCRKFPAQMRISGNEGPEMYSFTLTLEFVPCEVLVRGHIFLNTSLTEAFCIAIVPCWICYHHPNSHGDPSKLLRCGYSAFSFDIEIHAGRIPNASKNARRLFKKVGT